MKMLYSQELITLNLRELPAIIDKLPDGPFKKALVNVKENLGEFDPQHAMQLIVVVEKTND